MKRLIALAVALAFVPFASAQLYKWVDKDGKTYYSDQPPPGQDTKRLSVGTGGTSEATAPQKTAVQRDKELEKGRQDARDASKKSDDAARLAASQAEQCSKMKMQYQQLVDGGRIHRTNEKGEREILDDDALAKERDKVRADMEDACKKS